MIRIEDAEILDILPYTFKTDEYRALSRAARALTAKLYRQLCGALFWADIAHAAPEVLDAMAAELDAPFYRADDSDERRRAVIAAALASNPRLGTAGSVKTLLTAAFGAGRIEEWYEYGGEPYYFRADVTQAENAAAEDYEYFVNMLARVKNKRAKMEYLTTNREMKVYPTIGAVVFDKCYEKIPRGEYLATPTIGAAVSDRRYEKIPRGGI